MFKKKNSVNGSERGRLQEQVERVCKTGHFPEIPDKPESAIWQKRKFSEVFCHKPQKLDNSGSLLPSTEYNED